MSNSSFFSTTGATSNQTDAIEASVNNAADSEAAALASKDTATAQATISTTKATESAASAAEALVSKNAAAGSNTAATNSKNAAATSASAASSSASSASSSASTASTKASQASSSQSAASSSASTASTKASEASTSAASSLTAKNASVVAQAASEAARDASVVAKNASVVAQGASETAETNSETARDASIAAKDTSTTKANESAASAAAALVSKNSATASASTATTKANEASASATTSTASKNTAVAVTANFLGAHSSAPTATASGGSLAVGMLYFDTGSDVLKVRASGGWINAGSSINGTSARFAYTLSANQTTVSGNDLSGNSLQFDAPFCDVFLNGVKLAAADMNISSGTSVVLAAGATAGDILEVVAFGTFQLTNGTFAGTTTVNNLTITGTATAPTQAESDDSTKIATTAYVVDKITTLIGGAPSTLNDLNELAAAINDDANYNSTLTTALATKLPLAGGAITGDVTFGDNNKAIFGAGSDLKLYHSGSSSILDNTTGGLFFNQWVDNADITFQNDDGTGGTTSYLLMQGSTGEVQLKHYGSTKISTKAAGVEVAGNMVVSGTVDGVDIAARDAVLTSTTTVANAALPKAGGTMTGTLTTPTAIIGSATSGNAHANANDLIIGATSTNKRSGITIVSASNQDGAVMFSDGTSTSNAYIDGQFVYNHPDSSFRFYNGATTETLRLSSTVSYFPTGNVGIGTSAPAFKVDVLTASGDGIRTTSASQAVIRLDTTNTNAAARNWQMGISSVAHGDFNLTTSTTNGGNPANATSRLYINASGNVGIGTSAPAAQMEIQTGSYIGKDEVRGLLRLTGQSNTENGYPAPSAGAALEFYNRWAGGAAYSMGRISGRGVQGFDGGLQLDVASNSSAGGSNFTTAMSLSNTGAVTKPLQPAFTAWKTSHFATTSNSRTEVGGWSTTANHMLDVGNNFNESTGRFTAPVAGKYWFQANIMHEDTVGDYQVAFHVNNTATALTNDQSGGGGSWRQTTLGVLLNLNAFQYVSVFIYNSNVVIPYGVYGHSSNKFSTFTGYLVA